MANLIPNQISHVSTAGKVDADNSSTANLSDAGTFTGEWSQVPIGSRLILTMKADQDLTIQVQYSPDGTNQDSTITRYYRTAQIEPPHIFINARPYARVVVTNNSGSATTYLRLNTYIVEETGILNIPVDATMSQDYDSMSTRPTDFTAEVATNRRQGWSTWNKFGYNNDIDSAASEVIGAQGGTFSRMTSADTLSIVSSSASDTNGGVGVNSIVIYGIDGNRDPVIAVYSMNGTTPVVTTGQNFLGVNRVAVFLSGSSEGAVGNITITATTAGSVQAYVPAGTTNKDNSVTQQLIYHVPQNHQFLLSYIRCNVNKLSGGSSPRVTVKGIVFSAVNNTHQEIWRVSIDTSVNNFIDHILPETIPVGEKSILYFTASTDTNNTVVGGRFGGKLVRDIDA